MIYPGAPQVDLGPDVECGYLTVPENRADADGRTIRLVVSTRKATSPNPKPDTIVYLAGGPGGTPLVHGFDNWQLDRDLILFGERSTMKDEPFLSCPEFDRFLVEAIGIGATRCPTAPTSHCRRCATIRRESGRWCWTRCCRLRRT